MVSLWLRYLVALLNCTLAGKKTTTTTKKQRQPQKNNNNQKKTKQKISYPTLYSIVRKINFLGHKPFPYIIITLIQRYV